MKKKRISLSIYHLCVFSVLLILSSCSKEYSPNYTKFTITSVKVNSMSFVNSGSKDWDPGTGPDVFIKIEDQYSVLLDGTVSKYQDISDANLPLIWSLEHEVSDLSELLYIGVYDYDSFDPDDAIGYVSFKMNEHTGSYPESFSMWNGSLWVTISGEWSY